MTNVSTLPWNQSHSHRVRPWGRHKDFHPVNSPCGRTRLFYIVALTEQPPRPKTCHTPTMEATFSAYTYPVTYPNRIQLTNICVKSQQNYDYWFSLLQSLPSKYCHVVLWIYLFSFIFYLYCVTLIQPHIFLLCSHRFPFQHNRTRSIPTFSFSLGFSGCRGSKIDSFMHASNRNFFVSYVNMFFLQ